MHPSSFTSLIHAQGASWSLQLEAKGGSQAAAAASTQRFDAIITAMSANSTQRLLAAVAPGIAEAAGSVRSNVCWCLIVAFARPTGEWPQGACREQSGWAGG